MTTNPLYALRSVGDNAYQMAKFDSDFNVEATYNLIAKGSDFSCDCPANNRSVVLKRCKHRRMMVVMLGAVNIDRFFDPITGQWHQPLGVATVCFTNIREKLSGAPALSTAVRNKST